MEQGIKIMLKTKSKIILRQVTYGFVAIVSLLAYFPNLASAGQVTARSVKIGSSLPNALTTYNFLFTLPTASTIQSVKFQACDTASGACTQTGAASGFSSSTGGPATLAQAPTGLGAAGSWTINTADSTSLRIVNASNSGNPGAADVRFNNVHNPSAANSTFFIRITTYTGSDWTTGATDSGVVASSTAGQITVNANVDETLTFTLANASITLTPNPLSASTTGRGTSAMTVATNAANGYSVTYTGTTLTAAGTTGGTITAMSSGGASATGDGTGLSQFGMNLRQNTTLGGTDKSGIGTGGTYGTNYGTIDNFRFVPAGGEEVAKSATPTNANTFTTTYIANIASTTPAGAYVGNVNYVATANF